MSLFYNKGCRKYFHFPFYRRSHAYKMVRPFSFLDSNPRTGKGLAGWIIMIDIGHESKYPAPYPKWPFGNKNNV